MAATAAIFQSGLPSLNSMPSQESEDLGGESGAEHARKPSESGTEPGSGVDSEDSRGADAYDAHDPALETDRKGHGAKSRSGGSMSGKRSYQAMQNHSGGALNPDKKPAVEKPLEELTGEEIQQLTREECRRYLKEKGMRRPSWNKAQATQQLLCLKNLLPLNTGMKEEAISDKDASHEGDAGQGSHHPKVEAHPSADASNFVPTLFGRRLSSLDKDEYPSSNAAMAIDSSAVAEKVERDYPWNSMTYQQQQFLQIHLQQLREQQRQNLQSEMNRNSDAPVETASDKASGGTGGRGGVASGGEEERRHTQETNSRTESNKSEKKMSEHSPPQRKSSAKRHPRANKRQQGGQRRNSKQSAQDSVPANAPNDLQLKAKQETEERPQDSKADEKTTLNNSQAASAPVNSSISALKKLTSLSPMFSFPNLSSLSNLHGFQGLGPFSPNLSSILNALPQATSSAPASISPAFNQTGSLNHHSISQLQSLMPSFAPYQSSQPSLNPSSASIPSPVPSPVPPSPSSFFSLVNANKTTPGSFNNAMPSGSFPPSQGAHSNPPLKPLVEADGLSLISTQSMQQQMGMFGSVPQLSPAPLLTETPDFKPTSENSFPSPLLALRLSSGDGSKQDSGEAKANNRIVRPNPTRPTPQTPHALLSNSPIKAADEGKEKPSDPLNLTISLGSTLALGSKDFAPMSSRKDEMHAQLPVSFTNPEFTSSLSSIPKSEGEKMEGMGFYQFRDRPPSDHVPLPDTSREAVIREAPKEDPPIRPVINPQSALDRLFPGANSHSGEKNPAELQNQLSNWSTVIENLNKIRSYLPSNAYQSLNPSILNAAIMTSLSFPALASSTNANASENSAQNLMPTNVSSTPPPEAHTVNTPVVSNSSLPFFPSSTFSTMPPKRLNLETDKNTDNMASSMEKTGKMTIIYNGVMKTFESVPTDKANAIMLLAGNSCAPSLPSHQSAENSQQMKSSLAYSRLRFHSHPPSPSPPFSPTHPHQSADDAHHSSSPPSPAHHSLSPIRSTSSATSILPTSSPQVSPLNSLASQTPSMLHSHGPGFSEPVHHMGRNEHMSSEISGRESSSKKFQSGRVSGSSLSKKTSNATSLPPVSSIDQPGARKASLARFLEKRKERKQKLKTPRNSFARLNE